MVGYLPYLSTLEAQIKQRRERDWVQPLTAKGSQILRVKALHFLPRLAAFLLRATWVSGKQRIYHKLWRRTAEWKAHWIRFQSERLRSADYESRRSRNVSLPKRRQRRWPGRFLGLRGSAGYPHRLPSSARGLGGPSPRAARVQAAGTTTSAPPLHDVRSHGLPGPEVSAQPLRHRSAAASVPAWRFLGCREARGRGRHARGGSLPRVKCAPRCCVSFPFCIHRISFSFQFRIIT